ncbi:MAG: radical SAM protein, partial [Gammaproteobacteria bacterium]
MIGKVGHKAVLVYPRFDTQETFWSYERSLRLYSPAGEFGLPKRLLPPLGLMGLYGYLKPHYDEILLTDRNVDPRPLEKLIRDCDHVYIGGMLTQENELLKDAGIVKKAGKTLIAGGPVVSPDSPLMRIADHMVENEAEMVMEDLLTGLAGGNAAKYYRGAYAPPERFFKPDYASINLSNYMHMAVQISRGCPESCEFCDAPDRFGKGYRIAPFEDTRAAFQQMADLGWRGPVFIVDDNFIGNPKIALEVLKNLYQNGESIGFHHPKYTELTLRLADDLPVMRELRDWLKRTRFINCFYGVETPNKASLQETGKRQNLRGEKPLAEKLAYLSEQTGAGAMMGMIYGFDHDTRETVGEIIDFVNATNAPVVMAGLLNALPGTPLMARMIKQGRFIASSSRNNSDGVINFIPQNFSVQQAESDYLDILEGIYSPDA